MSFRRLLVIAAFAVISFAGGFAVALHGSARPALADNTNPPPCCSSSGGGGGGGGGGGTTTPTPPISTHQPLPPPGPVTQVKLNNHAGPFLKLAWTLPSSPNLNKVYVLRTLAPTCSSGIHVGMLVGGTTVVRTSAIDRHAVPGTRYCYTVFVTNTAGKRSTAYEYFGTLPDHTAPRPVTGVQASVSGTRIIVKWTAATTANHYIVVRGPAGGVCPTSPAKSVADTRFPNDRTTAYTDTTAKPGQTYCYSVFPVDAKGNVQKTAAHSSPVGLALTSTGGGSTTPVTHPTTPASAASKSSNRLISSASAQIVAAVGVAVIVFGLIVLAGLKLQGSFSMPARPIARQSRGYQYGRPRNGMAVRLHLSDYDTRALVIPAVLGVGVLLVIAAVAALVV